VGLVVHVRPYTLSGPDLPFWHENVAMGPRRYWPNPPSTVHPASTGAEPPLFFNNLPAFGVWRTKCYKETGRMRGTHMTRIGSLTLALLATARHNVRARWMAPLRRYAACPGAHRRRPPCRRRPWNRKIHATRGQLRSAGSAARTEFAQ